MSNSFITRRASQTAKTITFDGYTDGLTPETGTDGVSKWFNAPDFTLKVGAISATHVGDYAIFNHGTECEAYNASLEKTHFFIPPTYNYGTATHVGNYALFAGGSIGSNYYSSVSAISSSLERVTPPPESLSQARSELAATHVGNYALFAGGGGGIPQYNIVDAYNTSLERVTPSPEGLSQARSELAATHIGNYALFAGGYEYNNDKSYATIDAYNTSLDRSTPTPLSLARFGLSATHVGNYALFAGGSATYYPYNYSSTVDAYNTSLERSTPTPLSQGRRYSAATTVGDYALFDGGYISPVDGTASVEAYTTPAQKTKITLPPNVSYTFGSLTGTTAQPTEISPDYPLFGTVTVS